MNNFNFYQQVSQIWLIIAACCIAICVAIPPCAFADTSSKRELFDTSKEVASGINIDGAFKAASDAYVPVPEEKLKDLKAGGLDDMAKKGTDLQEGLQEGLNEEINCNANTCPLSGAFSSKAQMRNEDNLKKMGFEKTPGGMPIDQNDLISRTKKKAELLNLGDLIKGSDIDCTEVKDGKPMKFKTKHYCDSFLSFKESECPILQKIEVSAKHNYSCFKKRVETTKICEDKIESIECKNSAQGGCDSGGIVAESRISYMKWGYEDPYLSTILAESMISDMKWVYEYPYLSINARVKDVGDSQILHDRSTKFKIRNLKNITEFRLYEVEFAGHIWVKINGHSVYVGPYGGDRLEEEWGYRKKRIDIGFTNGNGWLKFHPESQSLKFPLDIDLKPFLIEGINDIWTRAVVNNHVEVRLKIKATQACCGEWKITRSESCQIEGEK